MLQLIDEDLNVSETQERARNSPKSSDNEYDVQFGTITPLCPEFKPLPFSTKAPTFETKQ